MALIKSSPGQQWPGFSFALHLLRVQGFYFSLLQYSPIQAFTAAFISFMQVYTTHATKQRTGLYRGFSCDLYHSTAVYTRPTQAAIIPSVQRWNVSQRRSTSSAYTGYHRHAGRCTAQHSRPIIIRYIRVQGCAPVVDPCQTVQHIADHTSPAGSAPTVCGSLASADSVPAVQTRRTC